LHISVITVEAVNAGDELSHCNCVKIGTAAVAQLQHLILGGLLFHVRRHYQTTCRCACAGRFHAFGETGHVTELVSVAHFCPCIAVILLIGSETRENQQHNSDEVTHKTPPAKPSYSERSSNKMSIFI